MLSGGPFPLERTRPSVITANTNIPAMRGLLALSNATLGLNKSMERLATGQRINRASDDPAGMTAGEELKARERQIQAKFKALDREEYSLGAREGVYSVLSDSFIELRSLVTQAANTNGLSEAEKDGIQEQIDGVVDGVDYILATSVFDSQLIMQGAGITSFGRQTRSRVNEAGETVRDSFSIADLRTGGKLSVRSGELELASRVAETAAEGAASSRGAIGTRLQAMDSERAGLWAELESVTKEKSRILDTDYASETANFVRQQVLQSAAQRVMQIAVQSQRQQVAQLLGGIG